MCIVYLAIGRHPDWPLFIAANRDEFHARATRPAAPWPDEPSIIAGRDLAAGGTWLGATRHGRYAFLTNYRGPAVAGAGAPSRGHLVSRYLSGHGAPQDYAQAVSSRADAYNGFNLVVGDLQSCWYVGNRTENRSPIALSRGSHVLSNHVLNTPWPKTTRLRRALDVFPLETLGRSAQAVFDLLKDTAAADDGDLPDTGIGLDRERLLSSPFIVSPDYGTRCSTVVALHASGRGFLAETSFDANGHVAQRHDWPFTVDTLARDA